MGLSSKYRRASKNLHETVVKLVKQYSPKTIIDLGSGNGGIPLLLHREGFNITATDSNPKINEAADEIPCEQMDLNKPLKLNKKYDMVICTEVIEHLYNSKKLFSDAHKLLNKNGIFIFSTPNNQNWFGRLFFLFTGKFPTFQGRPHEMKRSWFEPHITPIFVWQVRLLIRNLFKIERITFNRSVLPLLHINLPFKNLFFGQNLIMVLKKK
jgi:SAM-dependent methyltransferase